MRVDCKFYESRSYGSGETVRACHLNLAPEAPWRCPVDCPSYVRKMVDGGWTHGSLINTPPPDEPHLDDESIAVLGSAQDIVNAVGPDLLAEVQAARELEREALLQKRRPRRWWWPFGSSPR